MADWFFASAGHLLPIEAHSGDSPGITRVVLRLRREVDHPTKAAPVSLEQDFRKAIAERLKTCPELDRWRKVRAELIAARKRLTYHRGKMAPLEEERKQLRADLPRNWHSHITEISLKLGPMEVEAARLIKEVEFLEAATAEAKAELDRAFSVAIDSASRRVYDSARAELESQMQSTAGQIGPVIDNLLAARQRVEESRRLVDCRRSMDVLLEEMLAEQR